MSRHTLVIVVIIFLFVSSVFINETQTVSTYYNTLQSTTTNYNDIVVNNTSIPSYTTWINKEHERRRIEIAKSKDTFLPDNEQRSRLANTTSSTNNTTEDIKYLVVRCLEREVCGGFSDRMKAMPFYIMVANLTQRVLLIHWTKPTELEHYLIPPTDGIDWRVEGTPVTIHDIRSNTNFHDGRGNGMSGVVRQLMGKLAGQEHLVEAKVLNILLDGGQRIHNAQAIFNQWRKEPGQTSEGYLGWNPKSNVTKHDLSEDVFRILFQPSPQLEREIYNKLVQLDLLDREFSVAQVRAKSPNLIPSDVALEFASVNTVHGAKDSYEIKRGFDMMDTYTITPLLRKLWYKMFTNALNCADQLAPGLPIFLASDTNFGIEMQKNTTYDIRVAASENQTALHIDSNAYQGRDQSDFYLVFTDIYIMARAKCSAYGGGFGAFPTRMNGNKCNLHHAETKCSSSSERSIKTEDSSTNITNTSVT